MADDGESAVLKVFRGGVEHHPIESSDAIRNALIVDVETTGLDPESDRLTEFACAIVRIDTSCGRVVGHHGTSSWFNDPGIPIPPEITRLTGITDQDVAGKELPDETILGHFRDADVVIAHNAAFDRAFCVARWPDLALDIAPPWGCSVNQVPWKELGFRHASMEFLAMKHGFIFAGHRASIDVEATLRLLQMRYDDESPTYLRMLIEDSYRPRYRVAAERAPFQYKDQLKALGLFWDAEAKHWHQNVDLEQVADLAKRINEICHCAHVSEPIPLRRRFDSAYRPKLRRWEP